MTDQLAHRAAALAQLPTVYALALRLLDDGEPPERIGRLLGLEPEAVRPLLDVAAAKLAEILSRG